MNIPIDDLTGEAERRRDLRWLWSRVHKLQDARMSSDRPQIVFVSLEEDLRYAAEGFNII